MSDFVSCPCCALPTLDARGTHAICPVCWWEDDGANEGEPLARARANYADHLDCHDPDQGPGVVANPSPARRTLLAYLTAVRAGERGYDARVLHGLLRGLDHA